MSQIEEALAIGNTPAEGESTPDYSSRKGKHSTKTVYRVSLDEPENVRVVLAVSNGYIKTKSGILNFIQIFASLACLVALVGSGVLQFGPDRDDKDSWWWRYRLLIFVSVFSSLVSFSSLFLHTCGLIEILPLDWSLFDMVMYIFMAVLHFVSGTLVLNSVVRLNHLQHGHPSSWSHLGKLGHMAAAITSSYLCVLAYVASSVVSGINIRGQLNQRGIKNSLEEAAGDSQRFQLFQQPSNSTVVEAA